MVVHLRWPQETHPLLVLPLLSHLGEAHRERKRLFDESGSAHRGPRPEAPRPPHTALAPTHPSQETEALRKSSTPDGKSMCVCVCVCVCVSSHSTARSHAHTSAIH